MSHRLSLRTAATAAVVTAAVLAPAGTALASGGTPTPVPSRTASQEPSAVPSQKPAEQASPAPARSAAEGRRGEATPAPRAPRGGVAAGERPATDDAGTSPALVGSLSAAALLAGAGTVVLRRRARQH
ncbi:hypothetical protein GTW43_34110 [Streptomyces sp. SID5785]|uniref:hypothetical protein n=1 Tax=Streptomyces sp. SID5785 TaxID=2690309 RepID=UPI001360D458|nr:hypothetical protein [Streptomyces sp. SID5785]MZD10077.1 hypothetical protein [Streptomyces sp. SID5785]